MILNPLAADYMPLSLAAFWALYNQEYDGQNIQIPRSPGYFYTSLDAVTAAALELGRVSFYPGFGYEWAATIVSTQVQVPRTIHIGTDTPIQVYVYVTRYTFNYINTQNLRTVNFIRKENMVAVVHTHPFVDRGWNIFNIGSGLNRFLGCGMFSDLDINATELLGVPVYAYSSVGELRRFDQDTPFNEDRKEYRYSAGVLIRDDLPMDPNVPLNRVNELRGRTGSSPVVFYPTPSIFVFD